MVANQAHHASKCFPLPAMIMLENDLFYNTFIVSIFNMLCFTVHIVILICDFSIILFFLLGTYQFLIVLEII